MKIKNVKWLPDENSSSHCIVELEVDPSSFCWFDNIELKETNSNLKPTYISAEYPGTIIKNDKQS